MTQHQYEIVKVLQRIFRLKQLFCRKNKGGIVTKQAEIELAGQAASKNLPPLVSVGDVKGLSTGKE